MLDDSTGTLKSKKKAMAGPACKVNALAEKTAKIQFVCLFID